MSQISSIHIHLLVALCLVTTVEADWWDDFSNNLATDLSPLLALFGEQVTKQFLSESLSIWDNLVFAMAPLGIVTAVVSAIRVCGGPSLRAFIGRAQEGGGIAEAELCSSTSRDVCELYHNGAIVRVLGRPKILEVVHDHKAEANDFYHRLDDRNRLVSPKYGIYSFQEYVENKLAEKAGWEEIGVKKRLKPGNSTDDIEHQRDQQNQQSRDRTSEEWKFATNPNLSFNIGIKKQPWYFSVYVAAAIGISTQIWVVVFGGLVTYHWQWKKNDALPNAWAFPMMAFGTVVLSCGMFFCAFLLRGSTRERIFRKGKKHFMEIPSTIYVAQPGKQNIGDLTYDPFVFSDSREPLREYTTSRKVSSPPGEERRIWFASGSTILGFAFQFIGLRAMHSSVSVVLLAAILLMSIVRSVLRTSRLKPEQNLLRDCPDMVEGHELDWLALKMGQTMKSECNTYRISWSVVSSSAMGPGSIIEPETPTQLYDRGCVIPWDSEHGEKLCRIGVYEIKQDGNALIFVFRGVELPFDAMDAGSFELAEAGWLSGDKSSSVSLQDLSIAEKMLRYRSRLAEMTSQQSKARLKSSTDWDDGFVSVRQQAQQLKTAIECGIHILLKKSKLKATWSEAGSLAFPVVVEVSQIPDAAYTGSSSSRESAQVYTIHIFLRRKHLKSGISRNSTQDTIWEVDRNSLEAILGLSTWSIMSDPSTACLDEQGHTVSTASEISRARVIATGANRYDLDFAEMEFSHWTEHEDLTTFTSRRAWESTPQGGDLGTNTIWFAQDGQESLSKSTSSKMPNKQPLRLFGWPGSKLHTGRITSDSSSNMRAFALVKDTKQPIPSLCAQDVYQSCIAAMATLFDPIENKTNLDDTSRSQSHLPDVVLSLVKSIQDSGLGSREDAYDMVIPALSRSSKLSLPSRVLPAINNRIRRKMERRNEYPGATWETALPTGVEKYT